LHNFFLFYPINFIYIFIYIIIWLNKSLILINKPNKYNQVNILYYKIKYLCLHLSFCRIFPKGRIPCFCPLSKRLCRGFSPKRVQLLILALFSLVILCWCMNATNSFQSKIIGSMSTRQRLASQWWPFTAYAAGVNKKSGEMSINKKINIGIHTVVYFFQS